MRILKAIRMSGYRFINYLMTRQAHRDTIKHLNRLSNRELSDIGINRGDINRLVWLEEDRLLTGKGFKNKKVKK